MYLFMDKAFLRKLNILSGISLFYLKNLTLPFKISSHIIIVCYIQNSEIFAANIFPISRIRRNFIDCIKYFI